MAGSKNVLIGNAVGGDAAGEEAFGGTGVVMESGATVKVDGAVAGGSGDAAKAPRAA